MKLGIVSWRTQVWGKTNRNESRPLATMTVNCNPTRLNRSQPDSNSNGTNKTRQRSDAGGVEESEVECMGCEVLKYFLE